MATRGATSSNRVTVLQANPLRWMEANSGILRPIEQLDFRRELETLNEALADAKSEKDLGIDLVHKHGTTDNVSAAVTTGSANNLSSHVLHLSCHGMPYHDLVLEDEDRGAQFVKCDEMARLITSGSGTELKFVFLSACHSRRVGEELVNLGVPHVLCCEKQTDEMKDDAIIEFSKAFYRALACGKTLQAAFDHGKEAVRLSPLVSISDERIDNYVLLPESDDCKYHDVSVFFEPSSSDNFVEIEKWSTGSWPIREWTVKAWFTYPDGRRVLAAEEFAGAISSNNDMLHRLREKLENYEDDNGTPRPLSITPSDWQELQDESVSHLDVARSVSHLDVSREVRNLFSFLGS